MDNKNTLWCADGGFCEVPQKGIVMNDKAIRLRGDPNHFLQFNGQVDGPQLNGFGGGMLSVQNRPQLMWTKDGVDARKLSVNNMEVDPRVIHFLLMMNMGATNKLMDHLELSKEKRDQINREVISSITHTLQRPMPKYEELAEMIQQIQAPPPPEPWRVHTTGSGSFIAARNIGGDMFECISPDGVNCFWRGNPQEAQNDINNPPAVIKPSRGSWAIKPI
jgi:hypothetical protein